MGWRDVMPVGQKHPKAPVGSSYNTSMGRKPQKPTAGHKSGKTVPSFEEERLNKLPKSKKDPTR